MLTLQTKKSGGTDSRKGDLQGLVVHIFVKHIIKVRHAGRLWVSTRRAKQVYSGIKGGWVVQGREEEV